MVAKLLSKIFKSEGIILIDYSGQKYICGNPKKDKPITVKLLKRNLNYKLILNPDLARAELSKVKASSESQSDEEKSLIFKPVTFGKEISFSSEKIILFFNPKLWVLINELSSSLFSRLMQ